MLTAGGAYRGSICTPNQEGVCDATLLLVFVPLDWDMSPNRVDKSIDLTLDDFAAQVEEAELLSSQYLDLVSKYGAHLHVGQRLSGELPATSLALLFGVHISANAGQQMAERFRPFMTGPACSWAAEGEHRRLVRDGVLDDRHPTANQFASAIGCLPRSGMAKAKESSSIVSFEKFQNR